MTSPLTKITLDHTIKLAVQTDLVNKPSYPFSGAITRYHGKGWDNCTLTIAELRKHIQSGFAFTLASLTSSHRCKDNFESASGMLIDLDENSLLDAQKNPVLAKIGTFGFTTPSNLKTTKSNPDASPRCKIVCLFDTPVTDASLFERYVKLIMSKITTLTVDASGKDATRISYGNQGADWIFLGNLIDTNALNKQIADEVIQAETAKAKNTPKLKPRLTIVNSGNSDIADLARRVADTLGVTNYHDNQSNFISCPCGHHKNNDATPSAVWNRDTNSLYCYTNSKSYNTLETANLLNIKLETATTARRGLHNSTRSFLLNYRYTDENDRTKKPFTSLCRFLDAMVMYGVGSGWYTIKQLDTALYGLFSDRTLRYSVLNNFVSKTQYDQLHAQNKDDRGVICICVHIVDLSFSSKVDTNAKKYLTVPAPPKQYTVSNRPPEQYFIPTEQELCKALGITQGVLHDWLELEDLQSNGKYTNGIIKASVYARDGQNKKQLAKTAGVTERSIARKVKKNNLIASKRNEKLLGKVTDPSKLPIEPDYRRFLSVAHSKTGEMLNSVYCRASFDYHKQYTDEIYAYRNLYTTYHNASKMSISQLEADIIELNNQVLKDKAS